MLRLTSDHNFNERIVRGLRRLLPELDLVRTIDVGLARADDPTLLEWTAGEDRVLLTHDVDTAPRFAYERVQAELAMLGVFLVSAAMKIGQAIDELNLAIQALAPEECKDLVTFFLSDAP
jgi:predicted nuclease of predicted toxin-antitoxin system